MALMGILLWILLPAPSILLLALCLPPILPLSNETKHKIEKNVLKAIDWICTRHLPVEGFNVPVVTILILISVFLFLIKSQETIALSNISDKMSSYDKREKRCRKWRAERDFWISILTLVLWIIIYTIRKLIKDNDSLLQQRHHELSDEQERSELLLNQLREAHETQVNNMQNEQKVDGAEGTEGSNLRQGINKKND